MQQHAHDRKCIYFNGIYQLYCAFRPDMEAPEDSENNLPEDENSMLKKFTTKISSRSKVLLIWMPIEAISLLFFMYLFTKGDTDNYKKEWTITYFYLVCLLIGFCGVMSLNIYGIIFMTMVYAASVVFLLFFLFFVETYRYFFIAILFIILEQVFALTYTFNLYKTMYNKTIFEDKDRSEKQSISVQLARACTIQ